MEFRRNTGEKQIPLIFVNNVSTFFIRQNVTACGLQMNGYGRSFASSACVICE